MIPIEPLSVLTPSYSFCATIIVFFGEKPSCVEALCCKVDVINGGGVLVLRLAVSIEDTTKDSVFAEATIWVAELSLPRVILSIFLPEKLYIEASMLFWNSASMLQYSTGLNAFISRSLSTTILSVELCTRPALSPLWILLARSGDNLYPTMRSSSRLVC